ncbi:mucin-5B-like [Anopheles albimanus]|uniref:Uncharacterized protein n=1 Tax=Anopheles albimanus TaxID=7167 RepID=A0A182FEJ6_ANOAL|nr:mucin-5B-like [Anopheles albimanus]XP_035789737.1 mucin-5B-like [Anopheles albimanus]XP_035789738.1 mucin-5B-like [Anopheles albimanus]
MTLLRRRLLLLMLVAGVLGQQDSTSTVSPQSIFDLNEEDFKLWLSGREPKAWQGDSGLSSMTTTTTSTPATPVESVFRTTSTTERPSTTTTSSTTSSSSSIRTLAATLPPPPFPTVQPDGGKSWFEEDAPTTPSSDVLGQQFRPAGEDFAQWLERQMNKVQEVSFVPPSATLGDDQVQGVTGLVTRVTTIRNRIPPSPFGPSTVPTFSPVTEVTPSTVAPFAPPAPVVGPSTAILGQSDGRPLDLQQWLRDQLQTSQQLTDRLLSQWTPSGTVIRGHAGEGYQSSAVSYQSSALIHGVAGVAHAAQHRFDQHQQQHHQQLPFPGTSHATDGYLSHQKPTSTSPPQQHLAVNYLPHGGYYYSRPVAGPLFGSYVTSHGAPFLINYQ